MKIFNFYITRNNPRELLNQLREKDDIINNAKEYLISYDTFNDFTGTKSKLKNKGLDEKTIIEMVNRYMIIYYNLLNILNEGRNLL